MPSQRPVNGRRAVLDSKDPDGPILEFRADEWDTFMDWVKAGNADA